MMICLWYLRTRETQETRCGYRPRLLLFRCHQVPLRVIIPPEMLGSCWFVHMAVRLAKWLSLKCTGVAGLWSTLANRKGQPKLHPSGSKPWSTQMEHDNNAIDIVEAKRPRHKRPLFPLCWNAGLSFGHEASTLQNSLSGEKLRPPAMQARFAFDLTFIQEEGSESFLMVSACMSSTEALADWAWLESDLLPKMQV